MKRINESETGHEDQPSGRGCLLRFHVFLSYAFLGNDGRGGRSCVSVGWTCTFPRTFVRGR